MTCKWDAPDDFPARADKATGVELVTGWLLLLLAAYATVVVLVLLIVVFGWPVLVVLAAMGVGMAATS